MLKKLSKDTRKRTIFNHALFFPLVLSLTACGLKRSEPVEFCPPFPERSEAISEWVHDLYLKNEKERNLGFPVMTPMEREHLQREDQLFKLEDSLSLCD